jgi:hypothetical protein
MEKLKTLFGIQILFLFLSFNIYSQTFEANNAKSKSTTWNGESWSNGYPNLEHKAIFEADFSILDILNVNNIEINEGVNLTIKDGGLLKSQNPISSELKSRIVFEDGSSLFINNYNPSSPSSSPTSLFERPNLNVKNYASMFFSSPVQGQNIWTVRPSYPSNYISYSYNPLVGPYGIYQLNPSGFSLISNPTSYIMLPGKGYVETVGGTSDYGNPAWFSGATIGSYPQTFDGIANQGTITTPISLGGNNLVGNPYSNFLDANSLLLDPNNMNVISGPLQFWSRTTLQSSSIPGSATYNNTAASYAMYNVLGGVSSGRQTTVAGESGFNNFVIPNGKIRIGTAFLINGIANGSLQFTEEMRTDLNGGSTQMYRSNATIATPPPSNLVTPPVRHRIWVNLVKGQPSDLNYANAPFRQALVGYAGCAASTGECATNGENDRVYDAEKNNIPNIKIDVYSLTSTPNKKLAIQGRSLPFNYTDEIQLGYSVL